MAQSEKGAPRDRVQHDAGALVMFDFKAAFPSLSQEYLLAMLEHIGLPAGSLNFLNALYDDNKCLISCKGSMFDGFALSSGICQGCPLSPLLFAVVADLLLRRLLATCPAATLRAFADDTAMVLPNFFASADSVMQDFDEFKAISGMELNLQKNNSHSALA